MRLYLFGCRDGGYLLSPECGLDANEGASVHGPLEALIGIVDIGHLPLDLAPRVLAEVRTRQFAWIAQAAGDALLARSCVAP